MAGSGDSATERAASDAAGADATRTLVLVAGMGRSGTSALTRVLGFCGGAMPRRPLPAVKGNNDKGFWEARSIVRFHDRVFGELGTTWDGPWPGGSAVREDWAAELAGLVDEEFGRAPVMVLKDPRIARLLPLWERVAVKLSVRPVCVIALRHPEEVAASLTAREGFTRGKSLRLWLEYSLASERFTRGMPRVVVAYDALLRDWRTEVGRVAAALGVDLPAPEDGAGIESFLDATLRRHHAEGTGGLPDPVARVYAVLGAMGRDEPGDAAALDAACTAANALPPARSPLLRRGVVPPEEALAFTGERFVPSLGGEIEAEHVHRYLFAAGACAGKAVLDIACGEGYGSAMLAQAARSVLGVDIDAETVEHARRAYVGGGRDGLAFEVGDCGAIPAPDASFDVVVSFETIEHIEDHDGFLNEVRRVLRPGGVLIVSTPDIAVYLAGAQPNPFHKKELSRERFEALLGARFTHTAVFGQRLVSGSVIAGGGAAPGQFVSTADGRDYARTDIDDRAVYLIAVCSDAEIDPVPFSVMSDARYSIGRVTRLLEREGSLVRENAAATAAAATAAGAAEASARSLTQARDALADAHEDRDRAVEERALLGARIEVLGAERDAAARRANDAESRQRHLEADLLQSAERESGLDARLRLAAEENDALNDAQSRTARELDQARGQTAVALARSEHAERETSNLERELAWTLATRSWRWSLPLRVATKARRAATVNGLGLAARLMNAAGLPGSQRVVVRRRAALVRGSRLFDAGYYLRNNPDVAATGVDPAWHFAARGGFERRRASGAFDTAAYLDANPDVAAAGVHPFEHFITQGVLEGRRLTSGPGAPDGTRPCPVTPERDPGASDGVVLDDTVVTPKVRARVDPRDRRPIPRVEVDAPQLARTKVLAFYLPQFHPIPENDAWWGRGFTEWSNVARGRPMFPGHAQPVLPADLGFYDLRLPEVREHQADMARAAGIHGFCYHHYWFNGRRVLERPLDEVLRLGRPDFPFCVCWANENWTRRWDGLEQEILLRQDHTLAGDRRFMLDLLPYLEDDRYIRVDGRPVVLVYRADLMACPADTAAVWRDECRRAGLGDIHLCAVQFRTTDPRPLGFDAAVEFPPHHFPAPEITRRVAGLDPAFRGVVLDYEAGVREAIASPRKEGYRLYRGVMPGWDNTARRIEHATVFDGATPELYEAWLRSAINRKQPEDGVRENLVFINAWNEWAEGTVLEPRREGGDSYLRATARALGSPTTPAAPPDTHDVAEHSGPQEAGGHSGAIEQKLKRIVRTSPALNSFLNRHPGMKNTAAAVVRRVSDRATPEVVPPSPGPIGPAWTPGSRERIAPNATPLLLVSHDACRAGAQIVMLELVRELARDPSVRVHHLLCGGGVLEPEFRRFATTCCIDDLTRRGMTRQAAIAAALDELPGVGAALCNTAATPDAARECARRGMHTVSYLHELPTTIDSALGGEATVRMIDRHADRIVVVSGFVRDRLCERYGLSPDRLEVVHMGVFPSRSAPPDRRNSRREVAAELGIDARTPLVLGCGTIHHRKGTDLWVRSAAAAVRAARDSGSVPPVFVWVGWDQAGPELRSWCLHDARAAGIQEQVRFIGVREDTARYFAAADVFALSSREDPYPLVNLEALVCGTPVVAFDGAGGAPELLLDPGGDCGVVVPYGDAEAMGRAVASLLSDPQRWARMSGQARLAATTRCAWTPYMAALRGALTPATAASVGAP